MVNTYLNKYPLIDSDQYISVLDTYISWVERNDAFDRNHKREFEGRLMSEQEKLEDESQSGIFTIVEQQ